MYDSHEWQAIKTIEFHVCKFLCKRMDGWLGVNENIQKAV
jgi:hypothetical protein